MDMNMDDRFQRTVMLLGSEKMERLAASRVIIFGVGGVGGWCAEALVRSGVGHLTIVDRDCVSVTNINRQIMAMTSSLGRPKVEVLGERLLDISPGLDLRTVYDVYTSETQGEYDFDGYDVVIDAIDSLRDKALLIANACRSRARLFSSMGAARKSDPRRVRTGEFWSVKGCPLARALRNHFKRSGTFPGRKFQCVYSDELLENKVVPDADGANGTLMHATAVFGLTLAWMALEAL